MRLYQHFHPGQQCSHSEEVQIAEHPVDKELLPSSTTRRKRPYSSKNKKELWQQKKIKAPDNCSMKLLPAYLWRASQSLADMVIRCGQPANRGQFDMILIPQRVAIPIARIYSLPTFLAILSHHW